METTPLKFIKLSTYMMTANQISSYVEPTFTHITGDIIYGDLSVDKDLYANGNINANYFNESHVEGYELNGQIINTVQRRYREEYKSYPSLSDFPVPVIGNAARIYFAQDTQTRYRIDRTTIQYVSTDNDYVYENEVGNSAGRKAAIGAWLTAASYDQLVVGQNNYAACPESIVAGINLSVNGTSNNQGIALFGSNNFLNGNGCGWSLVGGSGHRLSSSLNTFVVGNSNTIQNGAEFAVALNQGNIISANCGMSLVAGRYSMSKDKMSFVWNGAGQYPGQYLPDYPRYASHGTGSFNINPKNGIYGFYIGESCLYDILDKNTGSDTKSKLSALSIYVNDKINYIVNAYALSSDVESISGNLFDKTVTDIEALSTSLSDTVDVIVDDINNKCNAIENKIDSKHSFYNEIEITNKLRQPEIIGSYETLSICLQNIKHEKTADIFPEGDKGFSYEYKWPTESGTLVTQEYVDDKLGKIDEILTNILNH